MSIILSGVVGSTAYGLAHAGSDVDRIGIFATHTHRLLSLHPPADYYGGKEAEGDVAMYEALKYVRLALKCNPTAMELLWLPDELYEVQTIPGDQLNAGRHHFLGAHQVRTSYLGYATQQFNKLAKRGDGSFSSDTRNRTEKHARHMLRLLLQGTELYSTGELTVRLEPHVAEMLPETARLIVDDPTIAESYLKAAEDLFQAPTALPERPNEEFVEQWLQRVRRAFYYTTGAL